MAFMSEEAASFTLPLETSSLFDFQSDGHSWAWTDATAASDSADVFRDFPAWIDSPASLSSPADASSSYPSSLSADSPASSNQLSPFLDAALALPSPPCALDAFAPHATDFSSTICPTALQIPTDIHITNASPPSTRHAVFSFPANPHPSSQRPRATSSHATQPTGPQASTSFLPPYFHHVSSSRPPAPLPTNPKRSRTRLPVPGKAGPAVLAQRRPSLPVRTVPSLADLFKAISDAESRSRKRKESPREEWYGGRLKQWQAAGCLPREAAETTAS